VRLGNTENDAVGDTLRVRQTLERLSILRLEGTIEVLDALG